MSGTPSGSPPSSNIVIFDSSSSASTTSHSNTSILISCRDGPQKLSGFVKRGRPRKGSLPKNISITSPALTHHFTNNWTGSQTSPIGDCNDESQINEHSSTSKFSFVTYTGSPKDAGPKIQRLVRRRAMLDFRRREREQKSVSEEAEESRANRPSPETKKDEDEVLQQYVADDRMNSALSTTTTDRLPKEITAIEPFNAFPIKIEPYILELLSSCEWPPFSLPHLALSEPYLFFIDTTSIYETMYTIEKHVNLNPAKDYWLPMAFQDAALLHAFIFCADGYGTISQRKREGPAAVIHLRKAIQIVNERLRAPMPRITDATIAVICTFAHAEVRYYLASE